MKNKFIITFASILLLVGGCFLFFHSKSEFSKSADENLEAVSPYRDAELAAAILPSEGDTFGNNILIFGSVWFISRRVRVFRAMRASQPKKTL